MVDNDGHIVQPTQDVDDVRNGGGRRYPSHLDTIRDRVNGGATSTAWPDHRGPSIAIRSVGPAGEVRLLCTDNPVVRSGRHASHAAAPSRGLAGTPAAAEAPAPTGLDGGPTTGFDSRLIAAPDIPATEPTGTSTATSSGKPATEPRRRTASSNRTGPVNPTGPAGEPTGPRRGPERRPILPRGLLHVDTRRALPLPDRDHRATRRGASSARSEPGGAAKQPGHGDRT